MAAARTPPAGRLVRLRSVGNWVNLSTPLGLVVASLGRADIRPHHRGLILAEGYRLPFPVAGAFTVGSVLITGASFDELAQRHPQLLEHEEAHTWQYLYCLGLPYYLAYGACLAWSVLVTGDRASANFFERRAGLAAGGYVERPGRPLAVAARSYLRRAPRTSDPSTRPPDFSLNSSLQRHSVRWLRARPGRRRGP